MFEIRLRILDVGPNSFLGIAEGFPDVLVHASTINQAERELVRALEDHLTRVQDEEATRLQLDDFPTVKVVQLCLGPIVP